MLNNTWVVSNLELFTTLSPSLQIVCKLFFINMTFSCFIAYILVEFISSVIVKNKPGFFALLATIGTFIPFLGALSAIIGVLLLKKFGKEFNPIEINAYPQEEYSRVKAVKTVAYGAGWANIRLHSTHFTAAERQQALLSVSRGLPRDANAIYSELVSDDMEELRVCAFSMLENQQDYLHTQINQLLKKYKDDIPANKRAFIAKQLALLYWELVYRKLSDAEFREILLERSTFYAKQALQILVNDTTLWILLSRINMENGNNEEGLKDLDIASTYEAPQSKIIPYLAEVAYNNQDYNLVKKYLNSDNSLEYILKINKIVKFWCHL